MIENKTKRKDVCLALILDEGKVFLVKRKHNPFKEYWAFPGGGLDTNEDLKSCVTRETKEETNLDIKINDMVGTFSHFGVDIYIFDCYLVSKINNYTIDKEESLDDGWFNIKEVINPEFKLIPVLRKYLIK